MGIALRALEGALELVCPTRCAGCDLPGSVLCEECLREIVRLDRDLACERCGAPDGRTGCRECRDVALTFDGARCVGPLVRPLSRLVTMYKDGGERRLARNLARLLADTADSWMADAEAITWVPASRAAVARRGFDHAALLARELAVMADLPAVETLAAVRPRDQRGLDRDSRLRNAADAFASVGREHGGTILLIDDVITTGATLDAAAGRLKEAGAQTVRVLALARKVQAPEAKATSAPGL